jgi:hypothetical protein
LDRSRVITQTARLRFPHHAERRLSGVRGVRFERRSVDAVNGVEHAVLARVDVLAVMLLHIRAIGDAAVLPIKE